ncbi:MFS transporter [Streptomyces albipurpureus]|uniref:MFS transporter n=1 Tax=Streptomyces albipurpureus TaxID=2897419 RepID=A0ABT0URB7_9ACTN|nr:MFS transporter [Streptomyces sp. CWNU-1]MCM2391152.1 MFS transporter [Streptomyces sp. CWNU-1]
MSTSNAPQLNRPADSSPSGPPAARSLRSLLTWLGFANAAMYAIYLGLGGILNPLLVEDVVGSADKVTALGIVSGVSAVFATLANPIAGALSDRAGRRNPFILGGAVLAAVSIAALGSINSLLLIALFWSLAQIFMNSYQAAITAIVPDRVPKERLGTASAMVGLGLPVGGLLGVTVAGGLSESLNTAYLVFGVFIAFTAVLFTWRVKDVPLSSAAAGPSFKQQAAAFGGSLKAHDFRWAFIGRALLVLGYFSVQGYQLYVLQDHVDMPSGIGATAGTGILSALGMVAAGVSTVLGGTLSDKLGRRKIFIAAAGSVAGLAMIIPIATPTWPGMLVFTVINGLAFGCFMAVDTAVVAAVLPSQGDAARDMGVLNVANAGPQIVAPFVASLLIAHLGGYNTLFAFAGIFAVVGAISVYRIRSVN